MKNDTNTNWISPNADEKLIWGKVTAKPKSTSPRAKFIGKIAYCAVVVAYFIFSTFDLFKDGFTFDEADREALLAFVIMGALILVVSFGYIRLNRNYHRSNLAHWLSQQRLVYWRDGGHADIALTEITHVETGFHEGSTSVKVFRKQREPIVFITADSDKLRAEIEGLLTAKP